MVRLVGPATAIALALGAGVPAARAEVQDAEAAPRPWLGVSINDQRSMLGGVYVVDTFDDTPAALCGLRAGDEILAVGGVEVMNSDQLQKRVGTHAVGARVVVRYARTDPDGAGVKVRRCTTRLAEKITDPTELLHRRVVDRVVPGFTARRVADDALVDDAGLRGEVVVLALFTTRCDGCAATIAELRAALGDTRVIALAGEEEAAVAAYVQRTGLGGEVATTSDERVGRLLSPFVDVAILVVDHKGVVRFAAVGLGPESTHVDGASFCVERAARALAKSQ